MMYQGWASLQLWGLLASGIIIMLLVLLAWLWRRVRHVEQTSRYMQTLMDSLPDLLWVKDEQSRFLFVNARFNKIFGRAPKSLIGLTDYDLTDAVQAEAYVQDDRQVLRSGESLQREELICGEQGNKVWAETIKMPVFDERDRLVGTAGIARDITARKQAELLLREMAHQDYLTRLPNRPALAGRIEQILLRARSEACCVALFFFDLDNFKDLNDSRGHSTGDGLLRQIAERLQGGLGPYDAIGRFGGDEFVVVLGNQSSRLAAVRAGQQLRALFEVPFELDGVEYAISSSIGMSCFPDDGDDYETLVRNADMAMYHAKAQGKHRITEYNPQMGEENLRRISMEQQLRDALRRQELSLHYQPKLSVCRHEVVGMEVLLRWHNPVLGTVSPAQFIPVAEQSRLILEIGEWVLEEAMQQNLAWQRQGLPLLPMAVNISALQVHQHDFVPRLISRMTRLGYPGSRLELELTEGVVMEGAIPVRRYFEQLRQLGVRISIDDFGTGYSNLGYLSRFPLDTLKIDRSFVSDIDAQPDKQQIVRAIVQLARSLSVSVVAEGVENQQELACVEALGVDELQGYLFSRPLPAELFSHYLGATRGVA